MGQVLHGSASTTEAVRRSIRRSQESVRALARRRGVSPATVQKWRRRQATTDAAMGPKLAHSPVLSTEREAMIVAFRRHALLPLDDCLCALQPSIPALTRSSLHRCLQRHGISRLPNPDGGQAARKRFKACPIGFVRIDVEPRGSPDIAEVRTEQGKPHLFVAVDRTEPSSPLPNRASAPRAASRLTCLTRARRGVALQAAHRADRQRRASETATLAQTAWRFRWFARVHRQPAGPDRPRNRGRH